MVVVAPKHFLNIHAISVKPVMPILIKIHNVPSRAENTFKRREQGPYYPKSVLCENVS